jgi:hypothetical protein
MSPEQGLAGRQVKIGERGQPHGHRGAGAVYIVPAWPRPPSKMASGRVSWTIRVWYTVDHFQVSRGHRGLFLRPKNMGAS